MAAWVEKYGDKKHRARYTLPDGTQRSAGIHTNAKQALGAAKLAEEKAAELGWRDPQAARKTWGEWSKEWWQSRGVAAGTLARDANPLKKHLMPKWGNTPLIDITRHDVKAWANELKAANLAPSSVQRHLHLFSASLSAAIDAEIIQTNPAARLKLPTGQTDEMRFLTHEESDILFDAISERDYPFISVLLGTGLRWGEAAGLQSKRVDLGREQVRVAEVWDDKTKTLKAYPKGRRIRAVPLPKWVADQLPEKDGLLFQPMIYSNWKHRIWDAAVERSGLGHVRPHDLRHTYASWQIQAGRSLYEVGALLGHVSPVTTQRYAHLAALSGSVVVAAVHDPRGDKLGKTGTHA